MHPVDASRATWLQRARLPVAATVAALILATASDAGAADEPSPDARAMRECSYALWYPWYVQAQAREPGQAEAPRPEPDGPRDPVGEKCLAQLVAQRQREGRPPISPAEIPVLRGAAKAGKSAALFQAFDELKASRQSR